MKYCLFLSMGLMVAGCFGKMLNVSFDEDAGDKSKTKSDINVDSDIDADVDSDTDTDGDGDNDTDSDGDTDGDVDTDSDVDTAPDDGTDNTDDTDDSATVCIGCLIEEVCLEHGSVNKNNECEICDSNVSKNEWSNNDKSCNDGQFCTVNDACQDRVCIGEPRDCDDGTSCMINERCDEDGDQCLPGTSTCVEGQYCDSKSDSCVVECNGCLIEDRCVPDKATATGNECLICDLEVSSMSWSLRVGEECDDDDMCTYNDRCDSDGQCRGVGITCEKEPGTCGARLICNGSDQCIVKSYPDRETNCSDDDPCTVGDKCNGEGQCSPGEAKVCPKDEGVCGAYRTCGVLTGKCIVDGYPDTSVPCDDTNDCTENDHCNGLGQCVGSQIDCDDNIPCTDDRCNQGMCENTISSTSCLIETQCYGNNEDNPDNQCQYCNANSNQEAWSNYPNTTPCNDSVWCNGNDMCNGSGSCSIHDFSNGNRCADLSGDCIRDTCDEINETCFFSTDRECDTTYQTRCSSTESCGGRVEQLATHHYCSGKSAMCDGLTVTDTNWTTVETCKLYEACNDSVFTCEHNLACDCVDEGNYYDSQSKLCWQKSPSSDAVAFLEAADLCGKGWRVPNIKELISLLRGCQDGRVVKADDRSHCTMQPSNCADNDACNDIITCSDCDMLGSSDAEDVDCYWDPVLEGNCGDYLSSSSYVDDTTKAWVVSFHKGSVSKSSSTASVRCVRSE